MALEDDVVVADRVLEEVFCGLFVGEADELLGAAEVRGLAVFYELSFLGEESGQVSGNLEDRHRPQRELSMLRGMVQWAKRTSPFSTSILAGLAWKPDLPVRLLAITIDSIAGPSPSQPAT